MKNFFFKILCVFLLILSANVQIVGAVDSDTVYYQGDTNYPIWVERSDGSMIVFKISSAREADLQFKQGKKLIVFDAYEYETDGSVTKHPVGPNGGYGLLYNSQSYWIFYPESKRFPDGQQLDIENPYQLKICHILIAESRKHPKYLP